MTDLYSLFGVEPAYAHVTLANLRPELERAGLHIQTAIDWAGKAAFADVGALVYYLHAIPWQAPPDFSVQRYQEQDYSHHCTPVPVWNSRSGASMCRRSNPGKGLTALMCH